MSSHSRTEVIVGAAVLAVAAGFFGYAVSSAGLSTGSGVYPLQASFRAADGISAGTEVRLAGVKIGSVAEIDLNRDTYRADTTIWVNEGIDIPDDSAVAISSEGLLGGNFVEIIPGGSPFYYEPGAEFDSTQGSVSLVALLMKFVSGSDE